MPARTANLDTMKSPAEARELVLHYCNNYLQILQVVIQNHGMFGEDDSQYIKHVKDTHAKFIGKINVICYRLTKESRCLLAEGRETLAYQYAWDAQKVRAIADALSDPTHRQLILPETRTAIHAMCREYGHSVFQEPVL